MDYCLSCLSGLPENDCNVCPYCGFDESSYIPKEGWMKPELFENRYFIGRAYYEDDKGVSYIAYDAVMRRKTVIRQLLYKDSNAGEENTAYLSYMRNAAFVDVCRKLSEADLAYLPKIYTYRTDAHLSFAVIGYSPDESLKDFINRMGTIKYEELKALLMPVAAAMKLMHSRGIYHGCIGAESIRIVSDSSMNAMAVLSGFSGTVLDQTDENAKKAAAAKDVRDLLSVLFYCSDVDNGEIFPKELEYIRGVFDDDKTELMNAGKLLEVIYDCTELEIDMNKERPIKPLPQFILSAAEESGVTIKAFESSL